MAIHFKIIGFALMLLALVHVVFPKYFNWDKELKNLSLINRQMMVVHTFFIALTVFLMGLICVVATNDLITTDLGKKICLGLGVFWAIRFFVQLFGYSSDLWKGKLFETSVHIAFTLFWIYLSGVFLFSFWF